MQCNASVKADAMNDLDPIQCFYDILAAPSAVNSIRTVAVAADVTHTSQNRSIQLSLISKYW